MLINGGNSIGRQKNPAERMEAQASQSRGAMRRKKKVNHSIGQGGGKEANRKSRSKHKRRPCSEAREKGAKCPEKNRPDNGFDARTRLPLTTGFSLQR